MSQQGKDAVDTVDNDYQSDSWTEEDSLNDRLVGNLDTCLQPIDFREFNQVLCVAPGEKIVLLAYFKTFILKYSHSHRFSVESHVLIIHSVWYHCITVIFASGS
ncbi:hypothetical protein DPMN_053128 [Dreissena polymorpha]|uniref:Uncharacterized protein n=1 Tax=Dreissena polymorpha TaxID=45954 RepID=A0A9D4CM52_DREPO|nr:hypothetical protein DPMN_053128 [Dreissena polymorpha]